MKSYKQLIEGVYDPNIFKAFFLAGGPGSGKSFVVRRATGGLGSVSYTHLTLPTKDSV